MKDANVVAVLDTVMTAKYNEPRADQSGRVRESHERVYDLGLAPRLPL
jgi:hypothetical protein